MQLSEHFSLVEFTRSSTATRLRIDNDLPADLLPAARDTCAMLERIRAALSQHAGRDIPISLTSGYRCHPLNRAVGSSETSDHPRAAAADWRAPAFGTPTEICRFLAPLVSRLAIGQLINEFPDADGWVHTSTLIPTRPANRIITITGRGTVLGIQG